jgi:hypothetical protein
VERSIGIDDARAFAPVFWQGASFAARDAAPDETSP